MAVERLSELLDGRNRTRACKELGIVPKVEEFVGTEEEAAAFVESQNEHRRHLPAGEKKRLADERAVRVKAKRSEGKSIRTIAGEEGVSKSQVEKDLKKEPVHQWTPATEPEADVGEVIDTPEPTKVTGKDGKKYPSAKPKGEQPAPIVPAADG